MVAGLMAFVVIMGGLIALVVVLVVIGQQNRKRRMEEFGRLAAGVGLQFIPADNSFLLRYSDGHAPFQGRGAARNILLGNFRGRPVCLFQYSYTTSSYNGTRTTSTTHSYAIWLVALPRPVPLFSVGHEGIFGGKVAAAIGFRRLDIGDPSFDDVFKIKCDNEWFGRRVLHPAVIDLLRRTGPWNWRLSGPNMISYQEGIFEPAAALPRLNLMCDLIDRIPADAWGEAEWTTRRW
ncbi:hypothetical protein GCM10011575_30220 [Microlunatus endophyticus]|uniref:DUF3137 domain-containing protein n=1 Tax=Microlunatus endophyticus TaxID=1716077 RepID=A0A917SC83_9ACTN|nr:hypothetical protein [Microlunatus endophyticus]GGL69548.1 hypothetical protein GCM10011575_30220 [Microlunatus endophyticus]